jgi:hypothetical protein
MSEVQGKSGSRESRDHIRAQRSQWLQVYHLRLLEI